MAELFDLEFLMDKHIAIQEAELNRFVQYSIPGGKIKNLRTKSDLLLKLAQFEAFLELLRDDYSWKSCNIDNNIYDLCQFLSNMESAKLAGNDKLEQKITMQNLSIERIQEKIETIDLPMIYGVVLKATNFSGRDQELKDMKSYFNSNTNSILIFGYAAIGKTILCKKFASDILSSYDFISCIWLHAETLAELRYSVAKLAIELGATIKENLSFPEHCEYLITLLLKNCYRLLIVIDNADVENKEVTKVITTISKNQNVFSIVTSRNENVLQYTGKTMRLNPLSKYEARQMLQMSITSLTDSEAYKLSELVQYFPSALEQASAYIKQQRQHYRTQNYSVLDYIKHFETKRAESYGQYWNRHIDESIIPLITLDMTICKLNDSAVEILKILAFLQLDVHLHILKEICRQRELSNVDEGIAMLLKYSLVKIDDKIVSIYRMIQEVIRAKVRDPEYPRLLTVNVLLTYNRFRGTSTFMSGLNHLNSVCKFAWKLDMNSIEFFCPDVILFLLENDSLLCAVKYVRLHFDQKQVQSQLKEIKELIEKSFLLGMVNDDFSVSNKMLEMDDGSKISNYSVIKTLEACLQISNKHFGEKHKITFTINNRLIRELCYNDIHQAINYVEDLSICLLEGEENVYFETIYIVLLKLPELSDELKDTERLEKILKVLNHLGTNNRNNGINYHTLRTHEKILKVYTNNLGDNHSFTVKVKNAMATQLLFVDQKRCIKISEDVLCSNINEEYKSAFELFCKAKDVSSNFEEQKNALEKLLQVKRLKLGEFHSDTIRVVELLAEIMEENGKAELALKLFQYVRENAIKNKWSDNDLKNCEINLERVIRQFCNGTNLYSEKIAQKQFDFYLSNSVVNQIEKQADTQLTKRNFKKAINLYKHLNNHFKQANNEKMIIKFKNKISRCEVELTDFHKSSKYKILKQFGESDYDNFSIRSLHRILYFYERILGSENNLTLRIKMSMAKKLLNTDKCKCAKICEQILNSKNTKLYKEDALNLLSEVRNLDDLRECNATLLLSTNLNSREDIYKEFKFKDYEKTSLEELVKVLPLLQNVLGENDKLTNVVKNAIGRKLYWKGEYFESLDLIEQVIKSSDEELYDAYDTMHLIGREMYNQEDYEKSKELLEKVLQFRIHNFGEKHWDTNWTKEVLIGVYEKLRDFKRVQKFRKDIKEYYGEK